MHVIRQREVEHHAEDVRLTPKIVTSKKGVLCHLRVHVAVRVFISLCAHMYRISVINSPGELLFQHHLLRGSYSGRELFFQCHLSLLNEQNSFQTVAKLSFLGQRKRPIVHTMSSLGSYSKEGDIFFDVGAERGGGVLIERGNCSRGDIQG